MKRIIVAIALVFGIVFSVTSANAHTAEVAEVEFVVAFEYNNFTMQLSNERPQEFLEIFELLDPYFLSATFENEKEMMDIGWEIAEVLPPQLNAYFVEDFNTRKCTMYIYER